MHIECGLPDPIDHDLLQLVCHGIRHQQGDQQRPRLPITINCLRTLKEQLRASHYSALEQRMLWASFTLAFYGFLRASDHFALVRRHLISRKVIYHTSLIKNRPIQT